MLHSFLSNSLSLAMVAFRSCQHTRSCLAQTTYTQSTFNFLFKLTITSLTYSSPTHPSESTPSKTISGKLLQKMLVHFRPDYLAQCSQSAVFLSLGVERNLSPFLKDLNFTDICACQLKLIVNSSFLCVFHENFPPCSTEKGNQNFSHTPLSCLQFFFLASENFPDFWRGSIPHLKCFLYFVHCFGYSLKL